MKRLLCGFAFFSLLIAFPGPAKAQEDFATIDVPAAVTLAFGINNAGQIVGGYYVGATEHGFLRDVDGSYTTLDVPGSTGGTSVGGINNVGQIVGSYFDDAGQHGFLLDVDGSYITLDVPGGGNTQCSGINDAGQIVGLYRDAGGTRHGFLATPAKP